MTFDRTNQAHLTALKALVLAGGFTVFDGTSDILAYVNLPENNVGGETGPDTLTPSKLLTVLFTESISGPNEFRLQLVFESANSRDDDISAFRDELSGLEAGLAAKLAAIVRPMSLAEVAFSEVDENGTQESVVITSADWVTARDNG